MTIAFPIILSLFTVLVSAICGLGCIVEDTKQDKIKFGLASLVAGIAAYFAIQLVRENYSNKVTCANVGTVTELTCSKNFLSNECRVVLSSNQRINIATDLVMKGDQVSYCTNSVERFTNYYKVN